MRCLGIEQAAENDYRELCSAHPISIKAHGIDYDSYLGIALVNNLVRS